MSIDFEANIDVSMITGIFPGPPGAGHGHPFELRAGPWFGGELQVVSLRGRERMNDVYRYEVTFATDQPPELVTSALFGMPACLTIKSPDNDPRVIQGIAASIDALGGVAGERGRKLARFSLTIVPRLWLLRHRRRNRIFQNKSIPEIVSTVLADAGIKEADCHWRADKKAYPPLPFVYQRGETDWDLFRRILASAGIFFFYEHASGFLDSMFGGAASAVAGAVGAAAGMLGGAIGSAVSTVESATGMVSVLCFGDRATETAAVSSSPLGGLAADAEQGVLGALGGAMPGPLGDVVDSVAAAVKEPSATLAFDDDQGSNAQVERVYEFEMKKTLRTKELRMLDRDLETARSWVGVASTGAPTASASVNLSAGLSLAGNLSGGGLGGALSAGVSLGASFDVDAPMITASELRQELYQEDSAVWQDTWAPGLGPWVSLSAGESLTGKSLPEATVATAIGRFNKDRASAIRMGLELERVRRKYQEGTGRSDCRRMGAGYRFTLDRHPNKMLNGEYTVTALDVVGIHPDFLEEGQAVYRNRFRCIPSSVAARPKRPKRRPKPGMEVARVVNFAAGKDIGLEANSAGYVRVRFRWDILDDDFATPNGDLTLDAYQHDDIYSVWLPVVQPWAGAGYGTQFIPREGMEVLVGFMDDQSERPVILGCLYSNENPPPWPEHVDHQKVGIRSQSRPGTGYNEISIDDRHGGERVTVHAQRDLDVSVLKDAHVLVHADAYLRTEGGTAVEVDGDAATTVKGSRRARVEGADVTDVRGSRSIDIGDGNTRSVGANETVSIGGSLMTTIGGASRLQMQSDLVETVGGDRVSTAGLRHIVTVGTVGSDLAESDTFVWGTGRFGAQGTITLESAKEIILRCGDSEIRLTPDSVEVKGKAVSAAGSKHVELGGNGPSLHLGDDMQVMSKSMTLQSSGARMSLGESAVLESKSVQLGKPSQMSPSTDPNTPDPSPALALTVLAADNTPLASRRYQVQVGSTTAEGTTDGSGKISVATLPPDAKTGRCTVWTTDDFPEGPRLVLDLAFDTLEPASSVVGAQKRLRNLGFLQGNPSESVDVPCLDAILIFQEAFSLEATGELDGPTVAKLCEIHP